MQGLTFYKAESGAVHVAHHFEATLITACGLRDLVDGKNMTEEPVSCRRCRNAAADELRDRMVEAAGLEAQLELVRTSIEKLTNALAPANGGDE